MIALAISVAGYGLAIWGGIILFRNASPDLGAHGEMTWPTEILNDDEPPRIEKRQGRNRRGFGLVVSGTVLQLAGTVVAALTK